MGEELCKLLQKADYRIFNLEVPLTDDVLPIKKFGANLIAPTAAVAAYKALGVDLFTISNNHILDQDKAGLLSTVKTLDKNGIHHTGAGSNLSEAMQPHHFQFGNKRVGVYTCCEHEFSVATEHSAGANPFDPLESPDHIAELKQSCDYVIVLYHGGRERYRYPSPGLQKACRKMVDKGADLVVCQHSHCIGCKEDYNNGTIVYGQGNFLFDGKSNEYWNTSLLITLDENMQVSYIPLAKCGCGVRLASEQVGKEILEQFYKRSNQITEDGFVEQKYAELAQQVLPWFMRQLSGKKSFAYKALSKFTGYRLDRWMIQWKYRGQERFAVQNIIECEAYRELLLKGLMKR